ncbi:MAG: DUF4160 domain-containing protein, partial [Pontiellaceae bacterium]|nr:DUF4160 domain-containing protein [Pontiellaceae bacterium]
MPKLYEYFGLMVLFYSNEHEPVHVHGLYQGEESRADLYLENGTVVEIRYHAVKGREPLEPSRLNDFKTLVNHCADDIVRKWIDYFVLHKTIRPETIDRK